MRKIEQKNMVIIEKEKVFHVFILISFYINKYNYTINKKKILSYIMFSY